MVADWLDGLPRDNSNDPFSTAVDFSGSYEFAYA